MYVGGFLIWQTKNLPYCSNLTINHQMELEINL